MSKKLIGLPALLILVVAVFAQTPNFDYPYFVTNEAGYIVSDNVYTIPCVGDWDDDNDLDLLVGVFFNGMVFFYENIAASGSPVYADEYDTLFADGSPISVTYG